MKLFRKIKTEFSEERAELPPDDLLRHAEEEETKPEFVLAQDYAKVVRHLRDKGFTWSEVTDWFRVKGVPYSYGSIRRAYRVVYEGEDLGY